MPPCRKTVSSQASTSHLDAGLGLHISTTGPASVPDSNVHRATPDSDRDASPDEFEDLSRMLEMGRIHQPSDPSQADQPEASTSATITIPPRSICEGLRTKGKARAADSPPAGSLPTVREESPPPELPTPIQSLGGAPTPPHSATLPTPPSPTPPVHQGGELITAAHASRGHLPQALGKRPRQASHVTNAADRISLTQDELQAIIQMALAGVPKAPPLEVNAPGGIVFEGGLHPDERAAKRSCHQPKAGRTRRRIDLGAVIVPMKIIHALEQGMPQFIPLSLLTSQACLDANLSATMDKSARQPLQLEGGTITVKAATFDASKERKLMALEWVEASNRYVDLLRTHLWARGDSAPGGPATRDIADERDAHFRHIQREPKFAARFPVYLEYDIRLRQQYIRDPNTFDPDEWQAELFRTIMDDSLFNKDLDAGKTQAAQAYQGSSARTSFRTSSSSGTAKPCDREHKPLSCCMYCGGCDHSFRSCPGGGKAKLNKDDSGTWRDLASNSYCVSFNGPRPCTRKDACQHLHACSLCLSGDHGAQACTV
jgi:hypothetical protein